MLASDDRVEYENSWWEADAAAQAYLTGCRDPLNRRADLRALPLVETRDVYRPDGAPWHAWPTLRGTLHEQILEVLNTDSPNGSPRSAALVLGPPGSGKTTKGRRVAFNLLGTDSVSLIDADVIRAEFPEYQGGLGSRVVETESAHITYGVQLPRLIAAGGPFLLDAVGHPTLIREWIAALRHQRYEITVVFMSVALAEAEARTEQRAELTGRFVDSLYLHHQFVNSFGALATLAELDIDWMMLDSSGAPDEAPEVVAASRPSLGRWGAPTPFWGQP